MTTHVFRRGEGTDAPVRASRAVFIRPPIKEVAVTFKSALAFLRVDGGSRKINSQCCERVRSTCIIS